VSFDIEPFGVDFKVNEGRNSIGSKASNDITIQDHQVSSLHGLILYKKNKFILTDELSTNGTLLNGEELVPRDTYELNDGDEIKIGDTSLLFKTAFKK
jgi:pSer/pThr/pTyr-binding forkhead associated (FHA) protein